MPVDQVQQLVLRFRRTCKIRDKKCDAKFRRAAADRIDGDARRGCCTDREAVEDGLLEDLDANDWGIVPSIATVIDVP
jgi:hypothetical protein